MAGLNDAISGYYRLLDEILPLSRAQKNAEALQKCEAAAAVFTKVREAAVTKHADLVEEIKAEWRARAESIDAL